MCESAAIIGLCDVTQGELIELPQNNETAIVIEMGLVNDVIFMSGFE